MRYNWINEYLLQKPGVTKDLQESWNWVRYMVGGKMFCAICLNLENRPYYINLKLEPLEGDFYRNQYPGDVIPGYYSNKVHWNSITPDGPVPDEVLKSMLDKSYRLILDGFSKKQQREILGLSCCGTDCAACSCYGSLCRGCNALEGKVFHAGGKRCPIYACAVGKKKLVSCGACEELPCPIWRSTRDPSLSDEAFEQSIRDRVSNLKNG